MTGRSGEYTSDLKHEVRGLKAVFHGKISLKSSLDEHDTKTDVLRLTTEKKNNKGRHQLIKKVDLSIFECDYLAADPLAL